MDTAVINLTENDFDGNFNLKNPDLKGKVVVLVHRPTCPHCVHFKPNYIAAAKAAPSSIKFAQLNTDNSPNFLQNLMQSNTAKFMIRGVPTVVSFIDGQYYSTYGPNNSKYRTMEDVLEYADGIGSAEIYYTDEL